MTVTTNWSGSYNGLGFGVGTNVQLRNIKGLRAHPGQRSGDLSKGRQDGANAGLNYLNERVFTIDLLAFNPTVAFETVLASITAAFQPISDPTFQLPLEFLLPGWATSRIINCRCTNGAIDIDDAFQYFNSTIPIEMTAADPLIYGSTVKTAGPTGLPSPTAGLMFPVTFPVTFGASTGGSFVVTNAGNYITPPVFTVLGPITNPTVTFTSTGQFFGLNLTLSAGDSLVIDMGARLVTLNGTAYRFNTVINGSSWFGIPVGTWSIGLSSADSAVVAGTFSIAYQDAWGFM